MTLAARAWLALVIVAAVMCALLFYLIFLVYRENTFAGASQRSSR